MSACKPKDKTITEKTLTQFEPLRLKSDAGNQIEQLLKVEPRKTENSEAERALAAIGLASASETVKWASKKGDNGNYIFTDVSSETDDGDLTIETLQLNGVHMKEDIASFDRLSAKGIKLKNSDTEYGTIERIDLSRPNPTVTSNISKIITDTSQVDTIVKSSDLNHRFGALYLENINLVTPEVNLKAGSVGMGEDKDTQKAVFLIKDIAAKVTDDSRMSRSQIPPDFNVSLAGASATGIDMEATRAMLNAGLAKSVTRGRNDTTQMLLNAVDFYKETFTTIEFNDFNVNFDTVVFNAPGGQGLSRTEGDTVIIKQVMEPATLEIREGSQNPEIIRLEEYLDEMGYDKLVFQGRKNTRLNKTQDTALDQGLFELKDGFRLSRDIKIGNLKKVTENLKTINEGGDYLQNNPDAFSDLEVHSVEFSLEDLSLVDRAFKLVAQQQGTSEKLLRAQAKAGLLLLGLGAKTQDQGEMISQAAKAAGKFLENGGTLDISFNPADPLTIGELSQINPNSFEWDKLGFTAATTP